LCFHPRVWQKSDPLLFEPYKKKIVSINRKPAKRQGRKAMDLNLCAHRHDRQATENELPRFQTFYNAKDLDAQKKEILMASKDQFTQLKNRIFVSALLCILFCTFAFPVQVYAKDIPNTLPNLNTFIETVTDGNASTLRGVYVSNVMALSIVQQPTGYPGFVSTDENVATQFGIAAEVGNVGLLAHNTHAGSYFSNIKQGDVIVLVYGDGHVESFMAQSIQRYQALNPLSPYSEFKDQETQITSTAEELFNNVYRGEYHLTLQTCIENNGDSSWGRLFIVATPVENNTVVEESTVTTNIALNGKILNASGAFVNKRDF
jgi:hypothetical protein